MGGICVVLGVMCNVLSMKIFFAYLSTAALTTAAGSILFTVNIANATTITTFVNGQSGPWLSAPNPSFNWGTSVLNPTVIDNSTGLSMTVGDTLTINYISGLTNGGGGGIFSDANGNPIFGDLAGIGGPAFFINPSQDPVYFMALLGAFTDSNDVIVGSPFKIGNGPFNAIIPVGASKLSMGFNDGGGGFFDNGGGITVSVTEIAATPVSIPEPTSTLGFLALSTLGAASTLKRQIKSSKPSEKETTKVG